MPALADVCDASVDTTAARGLMRDAPQCHTLKTAVITNRTVAQMCFGRAAEGTKGIGNDSIPNEYENECRK